jgi:hypothetical protein
MTKVLDARVEASIRNAFRAARSRQPEALVRVAEGVGNNVYLADDDLVVRYRKLLPERPELKLIDWIA